MSFQIPKALANEIKSYREKNGRFPPMSLKIQRLDSGKKTLAEQAVALKFGAGTSVELTNFLSYTFTSNMLVPVDSFSFTYSAPFDAPAINNVSEGDIVTLNAFNQPVCTGIVDDVEISVDLDGENVTLRGRDLMSQLEDQMAITVDNRPIFFQQSDVATVLRELTAQTRIATYALQDAPTGGGFFFATEPGESKLTALQRFCESINCITWMRADGAIVVGRPDFVSPPVGTLLLNKKKRAANVLSMQVVYGSAKIPNKIVGLLTSQSSTQIGVPKNQILDNGAKGPARLKKLGHVLTKTIITSYPQGNESTADTTAKINTLNIDQNKYINTFMKRELARQNINERMVQAMAPGHYNENGQPYLPDTVYHVDFDRGGVLDTMYCYGVEYKLEAGRGQTTHLMLCNLGCIVADALPPGLAGSVVRNATGG